MYIKKYMITEYTIITALPQFTTSKTRESLENIFNDEQCLNIVFTSNSIIENNQWKVREQYHFLEEKNIEIYSIHSKNKNIEHSNNFKDVFKFWCYWEDNKKDTINILNMCTNPTRIKEFNVLLKKCEKNNIFLNIFMDESDNNITLLDKFLEIIHIFQKTIKKVYFVTATPSPKFWDILKKYNIYSLIGNKKYDKKNFEDYRSFKNHTLILHNNNTDNPLEYIEESYKLYIKNKYREPLTILSPAHRYTDSKRYSKLGTHKEVTNFWLKEGYAVCLLNGNFKGFKYPTCNDIKLELFNQKYNINGELRDSLRKWRKLNPTKNIAIVGNYNLERGVTFNTDGFNFSHAIFSSYHSKDISSAIQLQSRTCGDKKFVENMIIICPTYNYNMMIINENFSYNKNINENSNKHTPEEYKKHYSNIENLKISNILTETKNTNKYDYKICDNFTELRNFYENTLKPLFQERFEKIGLNKNLKGPNDRTKTLSKNNDGFFMEKVREVSMILSKKVAIEKISVSATQASGYVHRIFYEDMNNPNSNKWIISWEIDISEDRLRTLYLKKCEICDMSIEKNKFKSHQQEH